MTSDPEDVRTVKLLRALWEAWDAADGHLDGFDGGLVAAVTQSVGDWTDIEWAGLVVYVGGLQQGTVPLEVLDKIKLHRLDQQRFRRLWGGLARPPDQT